MVYKEISISNSLQSEILIIEVLELLYSTIKDLSLKNKYTPITDKPNSIV